MRLKITILPKVVPFLPSSQASLSATVHWSQGNVNSIRRSIFMLAFEVLILRLNVRYNQELKIRIFMDGRPSSGRRWKETVEVLM